MILVKYHLFLYFTFLKIQDKLIIFQKKVKNKFIKNLINKIKKLFK
jgi:hypothetical protein